jgi:excisionase family DNA binding protein
MLAMSSKSSEFVSPRAVAEVLDVSHGTVLRWVRLGLVEAIKLPGGTYRIPRSELERLKKTPPQ